MPPRKRNRPTPALAAPATPQGMAPFIFNPDLAFSSISNTHPILHHHLAKTPSTTATRASSSTTTTPARSSTERENILKLIAPALETVWSFPNPHPVLDALHQEIGAVARTWSERIEKGGWVTSAEIYGKLAGWVGVLEPFLEEVRGKMQKEEQPEKENGVEDGGGVEEGNGNGDGNGDEDEDVDGEWEVDEDVQENGNGNGDEDEDVDMETEEQSD